jgi:ATP-dependent RNA helicase RhlE
LVILPTRELALQVEENLRMIGAGIGMRTVVLIGGASMHIQKQNLAKNPHVIIATPGRLIDHLDQKTVKLNDVKILVLDEADRMLDMGFAPQINKILATVPKERQTMLFSATMPLEIVRIANTAMRTPVRVEVAPQGTSSERVEQELFFVSKMDKERLLEQCLKETDGTVLVFSRTKHGAKKIARAVREMGHTADELHANRSLAQRKAALAGFKDGKYRVLVATDIAARGIDVKGIALVVNYDLPDNPDDYVHRIGRTGRAGREGKAISFATPDQRSDVKGIERLIRKMIPLKPVPKDLPAARRLPPLERDADPRDRFRTGGGNAPKVYGNARPAYGSRPSNGPRPSTGSKPAYGQRGRYPQATEKFYTNTPSTASPFAKAPGDRPAPRAAAPAPRPAPSSASQAPAAGAFTFAPRKFKK